MTGELVKNIIPKNDEERLQALQKFEILYTSSEEAFDTITETMSQVFGAPMSFVSLVDRDAVFYKSQVGPFGLPQVERRDSLCSLTILGDEPLVIENALEELQLKGNPFVEVEGGIRFYAGAPLITKDGFRIGTACIVDTVPRVFSVAEKQLLIRFAKMVMHEIEVRQAVRSQQQTEEQLIASYKELHFITDTMPQLVWATETDGYSFFFNKGWLAYTGLTFNEVKGSGWMQSLHPDDYERTVSAWHRAVATGDVYDVEYRLKRHDGVYRWFVARGTPMKDGEGKILKWYGTSTDIEEQKQTQNDLRESNDRFDLVSKATQDAIWDWNLLTNDIWWNEGFKTLFGYKAEDLEPDIQSWYSRVHPNDTERVIGGIHAVIDKGGKQWSDEYRFRKKDGSYAIVFDRGYALHTTEGKPYRMLGSIQDITKTKNQQEKIRQSEQRFQNLVRETTVGIIVLMGEEMEVVVVNDAYGQLIGRSAQDLLHKQLFSVIPEAEDVFRPILHKVRTSGDPIYLYDQAYFVYADGKKIEGYLNLTYQPFKETDGTVTGVMVLCQDVTTQVLIRKQVVEAEATARLAIESAELGTFDVDFATNRIVSSDRLSTIFDVETTTERVRYIEAIHPEDLPVRVKAYETAFQNGLLAYEARVIRKNGAIRWIRVRGRIFFEGGSKPQKLVGVVQDITEEKEFAEELTRQVQERTQELEQFTFVSHHDLQEPLRKIVMYTDMVRSNTYEQLSEASQKNLDKVTTAARRMSTALREVLNFASLNKEELLTEVDLNETVAIVSNDLELVIEDNEATILVESLPVVKAVPQQMHQLFYNLTNNALKFARPGVPPVVTIGGRLLTEEETKEQTDLKPGRSYYLIRVEDNGIGFDQNAQDKIFVLFQRLHSKDTYPGTGIGLALCKKVVSNHGGKIRAHSTLGEGSVFEIYLPTPDS